MNFKRLIFCLLFAVSTAVSYAQVPQEVSYQAVVTDINGYPLINTFTQFRFQILNSNVLVYEEEQTVTTDDIGKVESK